MPFLPETIAAFLAITRIGGIALPMFSGFGPQAVIERLVDAEAKAVVTVDDARRPAPGSPRSRPRPHAPAPTRRPP